MALSAYDQEKPALSREELLFVVAEDSFGTIKEPSASDLVLLTGPGSAKQARKRREDNRIRDTRGKRARTVGMLEPGQFNFPTNLMPSGTPGTVPVPAAFLKNNFGTQTTRAADAVQAAPAPTINSFAPATLANFAVGQPVMVDIGSHVELRRITSIDTSIHVSPDFSEAPVSTGVIYAAVGYTLANTIGSLSVWYKKGHTVKVLVGAKTEGLGVAFDGDADLVGTLSGKYQREVRCSTFKLVGDIAGVTDPITVEIDDARKVTAGARFNLTDGTNTETKCIVTSVDEDTSEITFSRGANPQAWTALNGIEGVAWLPTGTEAGYVIQSRRGATHLDGTPTAVLKAEVNIDQKVKWKDKEKTASGKDYVESTSTPGMREVKGSVSLYFLQKHAGLLADAKSLTAHEAWIPAYEMDSDGYPVPGKAVALMLPQFEIEDEDFSDDDGEQVVDFPLYPIETTAGNNEVALWFC